MADLKVNYRIYADVRNENVSKIVAKTKQEDTLTRYLDITVTDNGVPVDLTGCEVRIYGRKYDKTEFYNEGILQDAATGRCLFEATTQMTACPAHSVHCEIRIFKDNVQILSTMPFEIFVVESLIGESAIESSNEYGALVLLYQNLYESIDLMQKMVAAIGTPSEIAAGYGLATMWQAWEYMSDYISVYLTNLINQALANASVQGVLDILGVTDDTGGSTTAGTTMAKLNAILSRSPSAVKSIQHGTIAFTEKTTTQTITAVDVTRSVVLPTGSSYNYRNSNASGEPSESGLWTSRLTLKNATTVEAEVCFYNSLYNAKVSYVVIEFY